MSDLAEPMSAEESAAISPTGAPPPAPVETPSPVAAVPGGEVPSTSPPVEPAPVAEVEKPTNPQAKNPLLPELISERRARQELERRLAALEEKTNPKPQIPALQDDPAGHLDARLRELEQPVQEMRQQTAQQQQIAALQNAYQANEAEFIKVTPDYTDAASHLVNQRAAELAAAGLTPEEAQQVIVSDLRAITARALNAGVNPAERIYAIAKARGYAKAAPPAPPPVATAEQSLQRIAEGQARATSPSAGLGAAPPAELTLETLANISEDEWGNLDRKKLERVLGR